MSKRARETEQVGLFLVGKVVALIRKSTVISAKVEILFHREVVDLVAKFEWEREMIGKKCTDPLAKVPVYPYGKDKTKGRADVQDWMPVPQEVWLLVPEGIVEGQVVLLPRFRANYNEKGDQKFYRSDDPRPIEMPNRRKIVLPTRYPVRVVAADTHSSVPKDRRDDMWLFIGKEEARVAVPNARASIRSTLMCSELDLNKKYKVKMSMPLTYVDTVSGSAVSVQVNVVLLHHIANLPQAKHTTESYMVTHPLNGVLAESWTTFVESLVRLPGVVGVTGVDDVNEHAMALTTMSEDVAGCTYNLKLATLAVRETIVDYLLPVSDKDALEIYKTLPTENCPHPSELKADLSAILFCALAQPGDKMDDSILKAAAGKLFVLPMPKDGDYAAVAALKQTKRQEVEIDEDDTVKKVVTYGSFTKDEIEKNYEVSYTLVVYSQRDDDAAMAVVRERWENCRKFYIQNRNGEDEPPTGLADD